MLKLPNDWQSCSTGYVVTDLLRQAHAIGQYREAARAMTRSSLEFMLSGPRWINRPERASLLPYPNGWRINDWLFYVLTSVEDNTLDELAGLPRFRCNVDLIVPPWFARFAQYAVDAVLPRYHVDVYSISSYVDLRILWTRLDLDISHSGAISNLFGRYSVLVQSTTAINIQPML
jgi:hypothetical protein